jgi:dUTP pyrophosphatase
MKMKYKSKRFNFKKLNKSEIKNSYQDIKLRKVSSDVLDLESFEKRDWVDLRIYELEEIRGKGYNLIFNKEASFNSETIKLWKDYTYIFNLGYSMEIPKGYEAYILPRSSTFKNTGLILVNSFGVIDHSYCGDDDAWKAVMYATRNTELKLAEYPRLLQFRIQKNMPKLRFNYVESLNNKSRGGFGSTGTK